ncbi:hypothetical protein KZZ52_18610 [Dactylosporangium sp. AC04546]|uniref:hypothetical protein n=1 Tax=Dactylosporangium sp. AC04546 TaxID=2862460 RepID=UPI001EDD1840|nr:hypothetical protein [Dactylosporangium sp. AC04546]WVK87315.1 hypothetical protein KZZ52_18610 [Dactylosporangium sp. AC04546]
MPTRGRPPWTYVAAAAVAIALAVLVFLKLRGPDLIEVSPPADGVTIAGQLLLDPASPAAGGPVAVRATISADRVVTLNRLTVKVRDEAGTFHDFPEQENVALSTVPREIVLERRFAAPGTYTYYLSYQLAGAWVDLPPWQQFTIGTGR